MSYPIPDSAGAFADWPEALRESWARDVSRLGWSTTYEGRVRSALGNLFACLVGLRGRDDALAGAPPSVDEWLLFEEVVDAAYTLSSALTKLELAAHGLALVYHDADLRQLIDRNRRRRTAMAAPKATEKRSGPSAERKRQAIPVPEWPAQWRSRWATALAEQQDSLLNLLEVLDRPSDESVPEIPPSGWSTAYRKRIERGLGLLLGSMQAKGQERADRTAIAAFVTAYLHHAETSLLSYL